MCSSYTTNVPAVCRCTDVPPDALPTCVNPQPPPGPPQLNAGVPSWAGGVVAFILFAVVGGLAAVRAMHARQQSALREQLDEFQRGLLGRVGVEGGSARLEPLLSQQQCQVGSQGSDGAGATVLPPQGSGRNASASGRG